MKWEWKKVQQSKGVLVTMYIPKTTDTNAL